MFEQIFWIVINFFFFFLFFLGLVLQINEYVLCKIYKKDNEREIQQINAAREDPRQSMMLPIQDLADENQNTQPQTDENMTCYAHLRMIATQRS